VTEKQFKRVTHLKTNDEMDQKLNLVEKQLTVTYDKIYAIETLFAKKSVVGGHEMGAAVDPMSIESHNMEFAKAQDKIRFFQQKLAEYKSELRLINFEDNTIVLEEDERKEQQEEEKKDALQIYYEKTGGKLSKQDLAKVDKVREKIDLAQRGELASVSIQKIRE
jgi:hypothetical protein